MAWADFFLSRIGLLAAAGVLLVAALVLPSALAPRAQEAQAQRVADEIAQRAAALAGALPGTTERVPLPEGVEVEVAPDRVAARAGPYRAVRAFARPLYGPTSFGADGEALEGAAEACLANASCNATALLQGVRSEFLQFPLRPVGRVLHLERLGPGADGAPFASEPGGLLLRLQAELRKDASGDLLQRVEAFHRGGPPVNVSGAELRVASGGEALVSVPLPVSAGVAGTRGAGGVFHAWNSSGPLWESGESGWVNVALGRKALAPGDPVRIELWNGSGLLARAEATVEDRR